MVHFGYRFSCLVSLQPETDARQASLRTTTDRKKKSRNSCELRHLRRNKKIPQLVTVAGFEMVEHFATKKQPVSATGSCQNAYHFCTNRQSVSTPTHSLPQFSKTSILTSKTARTIAVHYPRFGSYRSRTTRDSKLHIHRIGWDFKVELIDLSS